MLWLEALYSGYMIQSKEDYIFYVKCDKKAQRLEDKKILIPYRDTIYFFQKLMRKTEYYMNCRHDLLGRIMTVILKILYLRKSRKLGFSMGLNVFGPGLSIAHYGMLVVNANAKIGKNCRIHEGVTIGSTNGQSEAAKIGDNVFIGSGAKIIGNVRIADNVAIGANAVVVKDILEEGITVGGVPAKKISNNGSESNIVKAC